MSLVGKKVTLKPTQGAYQKPVAGVIVHETTAQITVQAEGFNGKRFRKSDGLPASKFDREAFPCYKVEIEVENAVRKQPAIPRVLLSRDRNHGEEATQDWAIAEARYVIEMIQEGSSTYSDDPDAGKAALRACQQYLKRCGA